MRRKIGSKRMASNLTGKEKECENGGKGEQGKGGRVERKEDKSPSSDQFLFPCSPFSFPCSTLSRAHVLAQWV